MSERQFVREDGSTLNFGSLDWLTSSEAGSINEKEIQLESLILAQSERWRHA